LRLGEERPVQKIEDDHEVERFVRERQRRAGLQIEHARIDAGVVLPHQPDRFPGTIDAPVVPPVKVSAYKCGEAWSTLIRHRPTDRRLLAVGSAGFIKGALAGHRADVVYLGVGQLGLQPERYLVDYWNETVRTVKARRVILIHWDDFFRPLHAPLRALPYAGDDLDVSVRVLSRLASEDGVALHLPTLWRRADPWS
jgi:L-ascorbate metabolism protein UlaG (beta-lactamase superfamily)